MAGSNIKKKKKKKKPMIAKKAFVSVDHGYIERMLKKIGFGPNFINPIC